MALSRLHIIVYRASLLVLLVVITYLATTPISIPVIEAISDKANHIVAFFVLALVIDFSFPDKRFNFVKLVSLMAYGVAIEFVQYFLPYRTSSFLDLVADSIGILCYWLAIPLIRHFPYFRQRWQSNA